MCVIVVGEKSTCRQMSDSFIPLERSLFIQQYVEDTLGIYGVHANPMDELNICLVAPL